jgi:hypothetical protein
MHAHKFHIKQDCKVVTFMSQLGKGTQKTYHAAVSLGCKKRGANDRIRVKRIKAIPTLSFVHDCSDLTRPWLGCEDLSAHAEAWPVVQE